MPVSSATIQWHDLNILRAYSLTWKDQMKVSVWEMVKKHKYFIYLQGSTASDSAIYSLRERYFFDLIKISIDEMLETRTATLQKQWKLFNH